MKTLRYLFQAAILHMLFFIFSILPVDTASALGGWLGRTIGMRMGITKKAFKNLTLAMPGLTSPYQEQVIREMWDNLGRIVGEYPHLEKIARERTEIIGGPELVKLIKGDKGVVFFGGHLGNWEVNCAATYIQFRKPIDITYRALNNPWADNLMMKARTLNGKLLAYPKSRSSARDIIEALNDKRFLGVLLDQKFNEGIAVPFFGMPAMTNPVFVQLCQKYKCPLVPVHGERLNGAHFRLTVHEPLRLFDEQGEPLPVEDVLAAANEFLETQIRVQPGQWLWLHRRWDSGKIKSS